MTQRQLTSAEFAMLRKLEAAEFLLSEINASYFSLLQSFVGYDELQKKFSTESEAV
jgi:hypothetical protein